MIASNIKIDKAKGPSLQLKVFALEGLLEGV